MGTLQKNSNVPAHTVNGYTFPWNPSVDSNDVQLITYCVGASAAYSVARKPNGTSGYQVPVGKKLVVVAVELENMAAIVADPSVLYQDNDPGISTSTVPTNPVYASGLAAARGPVLTAAVGSRGNFGGIAFEVPAGKYVGVHSNGGSQVFTGRIFGKLVAV